MNIKDFLLETGMHYETINLQMQTNEFVKQMKNGLSSAGSSMEMIPTYIPVTGGFPKNEQVIVMDAGGTNLRVATLVFLDDGTAEIKNFEKYPMPGTKGKLTHNQLFSELIDKIEPVLNVSNKVGFCFSFPTEILPNKDGRIIEFNKEVDVSGAKGQIIGEALNAELAKRLKTSKKIVLLNDTVATMLGSLASAKEGTYESYIGFILGTGVNTCYVEECKNITKNEDARNVLGHMAVNMESGGFDGFAQGLYDKELDEESYNPSIHKMEKMISGAYQGHLIYKTVAGAIAQGLFSPIFAEQFKTLKTLEMRQVDDFCRNTKGDNPLAEITANNPKDKNALYEIIDTSVERAAKIAAVVFAGICTHAGIGKDEKHPVCIMAEGTSFKKSPLFSKKLNRYLKDYLQKECGINCVVISGEDVTLKGSAIAGLNV